jgi:hypothetical protein
MDRKRGRWASTVRERVDWLRARPQLHKEWQGERQDPRRRQIVEALRDAGLISKTTYWKDVNVDALLRLTHATVRPGN